MDMVEKVARAMWDKRREALLGLAWPPLSLWEHENEALREDVRAEARAAIEAMREPSGEMIEDGWSAVIGSLNDNEAVARIYRAMIDAALSNTRESGE